MRTLNVLLAILVSLAIGLGMFEVGLRLIGKGPTPLVLEFHTKLGWKKRPNLDLHRSGPEYSVRLRTNSLGLADDEQAIAQKPDGTYRVIALGDSFTQGFTVDRTDLFVDQLEHWWRAEGRPVEILNAGCEAYSTDQEVAWLLENGARFQPDAVALFAYENDLYWCGSPTYEAREAGKPLFRPDGTLEIATVHDVGPRPWFENWGIGLLLKPFLEDRSPRAKYYFTPSGANAPVSKEFAPLLAAQPDFLADSLARCKGALTALKQKCAEVGAKLVIVPIPSHAAVDATYAQTFGQQRLGGLARSAWSPDRPVETFLAFAQELGVPFLDARPVLRAQAGPTHKLYFDVDWHLNPAGNAAFAAFLHDGFDAIGLVPPAAQLAAAPAVPPHVAPLRWPYVFAVLWLVLGTAFVIAYKGKENPLFGFLGVGLLLGLVFAIVIGGGGLLRRVPPPYSTWIGIAFVAGLLVFVAYKLGRRLMTILELLRSFTLRGHWYLMPLVVVLLSIGSLLVVAASSPLIAPFIYTLF
jgi:hypothetical protein